MRPAVESRFAEADRALLRMVDAQHHEAIEATATNRGATPNAVVAILFRAFGENILLPEFREISERAVKEAGF